MIDYRTMLREASEPQLAEFSSKLTPCKSEITGVRIPEIRRIAKLIVRDDWRSYLDDEPQNFEEEVLKGIVIATAPMETSERIALTESFLPHIDNWATCDYFCNSWKVEPDDSDAWDYFSDLIKSGDEFRMRVSVVLRMDKFVDVDHYRMLLEDIQDYDNEGYYYRMGAAWAVCECYVKFPEMTKRVLESGRLCDWTQNKSIQKIRESYRVSAEDKESLLALKRTSP